MHINDGPNFDILYKDILIRRIYQFEAVRHDPLCDCGGNIEKAVHASAFDNMQSLERKFGLGEVDSSHEEQFIRRGRIGGWKEELEEECLRILEEKYSAMMRQVGYAP